MVTVKVLLPFFLLLQKIGNQWFREGALVEAVENKSSHKKWLAFGGLQHMLHVSHKISYENEVFLYVACAFYVKKKR